MSRRSSDPDQTPDPTVERLLAIGLHLREARQQRGEDLYDVADYLRIKPSYLFALEEGDLAALPGLAYASGFLRTYADHLGFNGAEVVRALNADARPQSSQPHQRPEPLRENRLPSLAVVVAALLLAGAAYGGWFAAQAGGELLSRLKALPGDIGQYAATLFEEETPAVEETTQANEQPAQPTVTAPPNTLAGEPMRETQLARTPIVGSTSAPRETTTGNAPEAASRAVAAAPAIRPQNQQNDAGPTATDQAESPDNLAALTLDAQAEREAATHRIVEERSTGGPASELLAGLQPEPEMPNAELPEALLSSRIVLRAQEASWIQVQSPTRDFLRSRTLEPGEIFAVPDRSDLALWTGNAGGLEIWVDGRSVGLLGQSGEVMRNLPLTPEGLVAQR